MASSDGPNPRRLRDACERGDLAAVNAEIAKGVDVNDDCGASWTALHRAAERGRLPVVRALLQAGADGSMVTKTGGTTALALAAERGYVEVVRELMKWGAAPPESAAGAASIYSMPYVRPDGSPRASPRSRAPATTTVGTREVVRRLDEERWARDLAKLHPSCVSPACSNRTAAFNCSCACAAGRTEGSPRSSPRPRPASPRVSPYASPSPTRSALNFGGSRKAPTADELRERIRVEPAEGEESPAPAPRPYTPLSSATTSSYVVGVTPRSRNPEAERITEGLAASYRSISSPSGVPKAGAEATVQTLQELKLHTTNVVVSPHSPHLPLLVLLFLHVAALLLLLLVLLLLLLLLVHLHI